MRVSINDQSSLENLRQSSLENLLWIRLLFQLWITIRIVSRVGSVHLSSDNAAFFVTENPVDFLVH